MLNGFNFKCFIENSLANEERKQMQNDFNYKCSFEMRFKWL